MKKTECPRVFDLARKNPPLVTFLGLLETVAVLFVAGAYLYMLYGAFLGGNNARGIMYIIAAAVPFVLVSILRGIVNSPRPEEEYDFAAMGIPVSGKRGCSLPSRHAFSAFLLASLILGADPRLGGLLLVAATFIASYRVMSGKHYLRDVFAGAALGIILGFIGAVSVAIV